MPSRKQRFFAWLKTTPYFSLRREVPEAFLRELHDAVLKRGTHVALWPTPATVSEAHRLGLPAEAALVYTPQDSAEFLAAGHPLSLLLQYADIGLSPFLAIDAANFNISPEFADAAMLFGGSEKMPWLQGMGIEPETMVSMSRVAATFADAGRYVEVAAEEGMSFKTFCEFATSVPLIAVIPAYQSGKSPEEIWEWMQRPEVDYDREWAREANIEGMRWHPRSIQSPRVSIGGFIRELYEWAYPGLPAEYISALIKHPEGVYAR